MNCIHDVPANLGRRSLRDQPSLKLLVGWRPTYEEVEKVYTSEKVKQFAVVHPQAFEKEKKNEINLYDWIQ